MYEQQQRKSLTACFFGAIISARNCWIIKQFYKEHSIIMNYTLPKLSQIGLLIALVLSIIIAVPSSAEDATTDGYIDWTTPAVNVSTSLHRVLVAQHRSGEGTQRYLDPGQQSPQDTDSVYIYYTKGTTGYLCTSINGENKTARGWVNTAWYRKIEIKVFKC